MRAAFSISWTKGANGMVLKGKQRHILACQKSEKLNLDLSLTFRSRAISVILGDKWKKMKNEERRMYTMEAKALAEEQKRLNPDCWKRKRTNSVRTKIRYHAPISISQPIPHCTLTLHFYGFKHGSSLLCIYNSCCLCTGFPADLDNLPTSLAAVVLAWRGAGQSLMDRLMPLCSPVFLRLDCDAEFTCFL